MATDKSESAHNKTPNMSTFGVPALVVSGFLGAGKTTLVKHLITDAQQQGLKLAVVSMNLANWGLIGHCYKKLVGRGMWNWKAAVSAVN